MAEITPVTAAERATLQASIVQIDAIFALEGFRADESIRATNNAVLAGRGSYEESITELISHIKAHKTARGFVYSKSVDLDPHELGGG